MSSYLNFNGGSQRDAITQALMNVQNPPPNMQAPQPIGLQAPGAGAPPTMQTPGGAGPPVGQMPQQAPATPLGQANPMMGGQLGPSAPGSMQPGAMQPGGVPLQAPNIVGQQPQPPMMPQQGY